MIALIVVAAFAVMAAAAIAGTGRLGEWQEPVDDSPKGHLPDGDVDEAFFDELVTPTATYGYDRTEVDAVYEVLAQGAFPSDDPQFRIVRGGYRMQFVDEVLRRAAVAHNARIALSTGPALAAGDRMDPSTNKE